MPVDWSTGMTRHRTSTKGLRRAIVAAVLCLGVALASTFACSSRDSLVRARRPAVVTAPLAVDASGVEPAAAEPER
jgi:hypothetical protein